MNVTPKFKLSQNAKHLIIDIRVPYVKISEAEMYVDEHSFLFYLKPYYLKLQIEDSLEGLDQVDKAVYDHNTQWVNVLVPKKNEGEDFKNLDMITKLVSPGKFDPNEEENMEEKQFKGVGVQFEVIEETVDLNGEDDIEENQGELGAVNQSAYGFDKAYTQVFVHREEELAELSSVHPSKHKIDERFEVLKGEEISKFDPEHYLCDFFEPEQVNFPLFQYLVISKRKIFKLFLRNTYNRLSNILD